MDKAYSYGRFSSAEQSKGKSKQRQDQLCKEYCRENGLTLEKDYTFFDTGLSAYKGDHVGEKGQLRRFLNLVEDGTIEEGSYLIVENLDRLSREHIRHALPRFIDLLNKGIKVVTLQDRKLYTKDYVEMDLILSILIMSRAHEESSAKAGRVRYNWTAKHNAARDELKPVGRAVPMWLVLTPDGYALDEDRAAVVKLIFEYTISGFGRTAIIKMLNDEGVKAFKGGSWGGSSIAKILENRATFGEYNPHSIQQTGTRQALGEPIKGYFPSIISEETFYLAKAAVQTRKVSGATKQSENFNVFQGIAKCSECSAAMHLVNKGNSPKGGKKLYCFNTRKGICKAKAIRLDDAEAAFKELLVRVDSLPLVQGSSKSIERQIIEISGKLAEEKIKYDEYVTGLDARYSKVLDDLAFKADSQIKEMQADKQRLEEELALETIINKDEFFSKLDLTSYDGRFRANALLKRLGVMVVMGGNGRGDNHYFAVKDKSPFLIIDQKKTSGMVISPLDTDQISKVMLLDVGEDFEQRVRALLLGHLFNGETFSAELVREIIEELEKGDFENMKKYF